MAEIRYIQGDIFDAPTQVIVNTVNCQGVMGKGLALAFKQRYPEMFPIYQQECKTGKLRIGRPSLYQKSTPWILNFPTKGSWKANSKIEYLEKGLEYFLENYKKAGITSIAFPKLGAQNGKLSWDEVGPLMAKYLSKLDIDIYIYIAESDKEYQYDELSESRLEETILKHFNELALSQEQLQQEVPLNQKDAKKVFSLREVAEFTTLSDIYAIEGLAKASLKHLKDYFNHQRHPAKELPGMSDGQAPSDRKAKRKARSSKRKRKSEPENLERSNTVPLFSPQEVTI
ncbi:MAG: macro domain-containing protein [Ktedonobacteraceae bacterium]|nr:macro domain-containing protein [Ktedonobacteraceae bacterium]